MVQILTISMNYSKLPFRLSIIQKWYTSGLNQKSVESWFLLYKIYVNLDQTTLPYSSMITYPEFPTLHPNPISKMSFLRKKTKSYLLISKISMHLLLLRATIVITVRLMSGDQKKSRLILSGLILWKIAFLTHLSIWWPLLGKQ